MNEVDTTIVCDNQRLIISAMAGRIARLDEAVVHEQAKGYKAEGAMMARNSAIDALVEYIEDNVLDEYDEDVEQP